MLHLSTAPASQRSAITDQRGSTCSRDGVHCQSYGLPQFYLLQSCIGDHPLAANLLECGSMARYWADFFQDFQLRGCNRMTVVQAKLGPTEGLWFGGVTSLQGVYPTKGGLEKSLLLGSVSIVMSFRDGQKSEART
jgi:hypothetical protein